MHPLLKELNRCALIVFLKTFQEYSIGRAWISLVLMRFFFHFFFETFMRAFEKKKGTHFLKAINLQPCTQNILP